MNWERGGEHFIRTAGYTVAKYRVFDMTRYEAWRCVANRQPELLGAGFQTADEAKRVCEQDARKAA